MNEAIVGNCLHLYLQNYVLLSSLDGQESLPSELKDEGELLSSFSERSSDQASALLESLYSRLLTGSALPYRVQRRSQRRTVRELWRMEGPLFRPREKLARNSWSLYLGCLRDKGPAACLVLAPNEPENAFAIESLASQAAPSLGLESANPRSCFSHDSGYEAGLIVGAAVLSPTEHHDAVAVVIKGQVEHFFEKHRNSFEQVLDGG